MILVECGVDEGMRAEVCRLVRLHETGGDERSDILRERRLPFPTSKTIFLSTSLEMAGWKRNDVPCGVIRGSLRNFDIS